MKARHALIGIEPDTHVVKVIALVSEDVLDTLRVMRGLFVAVTSAEHAESIWGEVVDLNELMRQCTTGKAMADGHVDYVQRSGTG